MRTNRKELKLCIHSFSVNFMKKNDAAYIRVVENGFVLEQPEDPNNPSICGAFLAQTDAHAYTDASWIRGGWSFDVLTTVWRRICEGACENHVYEDDYPHYSGATLSVPFNTSSNGVIP